MKHNNFNKYLGNEDRLQIAVCEYVHLQYKGAAIHHSPNEGKRTKFERFKLSVLGCKSGYPDLHIIHNGKQVFIELKTKANKALKIRSGKISDNQQAWIDVFNNNGIPAYVCFGFDEAKAAIDKHFKN